MGRPMLFGMGLKKTDNERLMREFDLLKHVYRCNTALPPNVTIPPGDDMGGILLRDAQVLVTVDQLAEGRHFDLAIDPLEKVGRKAITRNLSDVAAMAAAPLACVAAVCLPKNFGQEKTLTLFEAMRTTAQIFACPLIGGDISMWDHPLLMSVTVLAKPDGIEPVRRTTASKNDLIYVTGHLGGSRMNRNGYVHHLDFTPRITLARRLASHPMTRPGSMIDISDGLARDVGHLVEQQPLMAILYADRLPIGDAAKQVAAGDGHPAWHHALADGEDYELCFTISPHQASNLPDEIDGAAITCIGQIESATSSDQAGQVILQQPDGQRLSVSELGWEHTA